MDEMYGGPVDFTAEERNAWIRGYLWTLEHIEDSGVRADLANLRNVDRVQVLIVPYLDLPVPEQRSRHLDLTAPDRKMPEAS